MTLVTVLYAICIISAVAFLRHAHGHYRPFQVIKENFIHCRSITAQMGFCCPDPCSYSFADLDISSVAVY